MFLYLLLQSQSLIISSVSLSSNDDARIRYISKLNANNPFTRGTLPKNDGDFKYHYYYTDEYFANPPTVFSPEFTTMTYFLCYSAFDARYDPTDENPVHGSRSNFLVLMDQLGVAPENISWNKASEKEPTGFSIGVSYASKKIHVNNEDYTLIIVAIRGSGYGKEWAGNMYLGPEGDHAGFALARDDVLKYLYKHVEKNGITGKVKVWITGYSRAAATTNMVAGYLINNGTLSEDVHLDRNDLYAFCFEPPAGAAITLEEKLDPKYAGIVNILNPNDIVPLVPPKQFGFRRYGPDRYMPSMDITPNYPELHKSMLERFAVEGGSELDHPELDDFRMKKFGLLEDGSTSNKLIQDDWTDPASLEIFVNEFVDYLVELLGSRQAYVDILEDPLVKLFEVIFAPNPTLLSPLCDSLLEFVTDDVFPRDEQLDETLWEKTLQRILVNHGLEVITTSIWKEFIVVIKKVLVPFVIHKPKWVLTVLSQVMPVVSPHYGEVCVSWLESMDPNYSEHPEARAIFALTPEMSRFLNFHGPLDITVVDDETQAVVAKIVNDVRVDIPGSSILYGIDKEGEKYVRLPPDSSYTVTMTATSPADVSYGLRCYSRAYDLCIRNINWLGRSVAQGAVLTATVPAMTLEEQAGNFNTSLTIYTLTDAKGTQYIPDLDYVGEYAAMYRYSVAAHVQSNAGTVTGTGYKYFGEFVHVEATPSKTSSSTFAGWYQDSLLFSNSNPYVNVLKDNLALTAKFSSKLESTVSQQSGAIPSQSINYWQYIAIVSASVAFVAICVLAVILVRSLKKKASNHSLHHFEYQPIPSSY